MVEIIELSPEAVRPLRQQVLRPHQSVDEMLWPGDLDPDARHFGAALDGKLVGVVTTYPQVFSPDPARPGYQFRGLATLPETQGTGVGKALLHQCIEYARQQNAELVWCKARRSTIGFYERMGFRHVGEDFLDPFGNPHILMIKDLTTIHEKSPSEN